MFTVCTRRVALACLNFPQTRATNTRSLIYFTCMRTSTIVLVQQWLASFCMNSGHFFEPRGLSNCFPSSHFGVVRLGCVPVTSCQETVMLGRFFSRTLGSFQRFKSLSEQWTTLQLPYVGERSLTCLSNADRKIMTRTQKNAKKFCVTEDVSPS